MKPKPTKSQFIEAFKMFASEQGWSEILRHYCEYKTENWFGTRMFVHQWQDGQIERKDTYHFDKHGIVLFSSQKRYDFGARWIEQE